MIIVIKPGSRFNSIKEFRIKNLHKRSRSHFLIEINPQSHYYIVLRVNICSKVATTPLKEQKASKVHTKVINGQNSENTRQVRIRTQDQQVQGRSKFHRQPQSRCPTRTKHQKIKILFANRSWVAA